MPLPPLPSPPVVALLSDMGLDDWYVGTMKGVLLSVAPSVRLADICHSMPKQSVQDAAFILDMSHSYFPTGTVFLCVVDPDVGSRRDPIVAHNERFYFVAPNNGLLTFAANRSTEWEARTIENLAYQLPGRSQTFHGRDVFAPAAGHLAAGAPFDTFGPPLAEIYKLPFIENIVLHEKSATGRVVYIDSYGNLLTNVTPDTLANCSDLSRIKLQFKQHVVTGIALHFAAVPLYHPLMYWGSSGYLEIAINRGSAERKWSAVVGEWFELEWP